MRVSKQDLYQAISEIQHNTKGYEELSHYQLKWRMRTIDGIIEHVELMLAQERATNATRTESKQTAGNQ